MSARRHVPLTVREADPRTCTSEVRVRALARVPFFTELTDDQMRGVDARCGLRSLDAGEAIYFAGQQAARLYVIAQGTVKLTTATVEGRELLFDVLGPGDYLGGLPALGEQTFAHAAWTLTPACLLSLGSAEFSAVLGSYPSVARAGLMVVGRRLRAAQETIHRLHSASAEQRVAATLLVLAGRLGHTRDGRVVIDAPLARDELAGLAGCAPATASRILARLRRDGAIDAGRRWVAIRDRAMLEALAEPG